MTEYEYKDNTSGFGMRKDAEIPPEINGWSWAGFGLNWIWAIFNNTWIGLLVFTPYIGFIMCFILGIYGRKWAWKNKKWRSVEHFNSVQRKWTIATLIIYLTAALLGALFIVLLIVSDATFVTR